MDFDDQDDINGGAEGEGGLGGDEVFLFGMDEGEAKEA